MLRRDLLKAIPAFAAGLFINPVNLLANIETTPKVDLDNWQFKEIDKWLKHYHGDLHIVYDHTNPLNKIMRYFDDNNITSDVIWGPSIDGKFTLPDGRMVIIYSTSNYRGRNLTPKDSFIGWDESGLKTYRQIITDCHEREVNKPIIGPITESVDFVGNEKIYKGLYHNMQTAYMDGDFQSYTSSYNMFTHEVYYWGLSPFKKG